jgi:ribosomal-protein-serine acetyltransferase
VFTLDAGDGITLKAYTLDDAPVLFAAVEESRQFLSQWFPWVAANTTVDDSRRFIEDMCQKADMQEELALGIFFGDALVGSIGLHHWEHPLKRAQLGYWVSRNAEGKGFATRAVRCLIHFVFANTDIGKLEIHYAAANVRSAAVAARLGFAKEGVLRRACVRNGIVDDLVVTGLLREEWQSR